MKKRAFFWVLSLIAASSQLIQASLTVIENEEQFNKIANADTPSIFVFSTEWCPACKQFKGPLEKVANNPVFSAITFALVDTNKFDAIARKHKIQSLPTIHFMQAGQHKKEVIGAIPEIKLIDSINTVFANALQTSPANLEKKETLTGMIQEEARQAEQKIETASKEIKEATKDIKEALVEVHKEATTTEPVESAGTFEMVWNIIASIFIYIKDLIVSFFSATIAFFKNLFGSK